MSQRTRSCYKQTPHQPTTTSTPSLNTALVDDTKSDWASTRTPNSNITNQPYNMSHITVIQHAKAVTHQRVKIKALTPKLHITIDMELQGLKDKILPVLERYEVKRAAVFGSFVRGEQKENSDIDILVEFKGTKSLLDLAGLKIELEETLDRKVDVLTYKSLHPLLKDRILKEQKVIL